LQKTLSISSLVLFRFTEVFDSAFLFQSALHKSKENDVKTGKKHARYTGQLKQLFATETLSRDCSNPGEHLFEQQATFQAFPYRKIGDKQRKPPRYGLLVNC